MAVILRARGRFLSYVISMNSGGRGLMSVEPVQDNRCRGGRD